MGLVGQSPLLHPSVMTLLSAEREGGLDMGVIICWWDRVAGLTLLH